MTPHTRFYIMAILRIILLGNNFHHKTTLSMYCSVKCEQKTVKHAYHTTCVNCAMESGICEKCGIPSDSITRLEFLKFVAFYKEHRML